jgi:hypothetical protein
VLRRHDKVDRRRVSISLSVKGKRVHREIEHVRYALEYEFLSVLDDDELSLLYTIIDKLEPQAREIFTPKGAWKRIFEKHRALFLFQVELCHEGLPLHGALSYHVGEVRWRVGRGVDALLRKSLLHRRVLQACGDCSIQT